MNKWLLAIILFLIALNVFILGSKRISYLEEEREIWCKEQGFDFSKSYGFPLSHKCQKLVGDTLIEKEFIYHCRGKSKGWACGEPTFITFIEMAQSNANVTGVKG